MNLAQAPEGFFKRKLEMLLVKRQGLRRKSAKKFVGRLMKAIQAGDKIDMQPTENESFLIVFKNKEPTTDLPTEWLTFELKSSEIEELMFRVVV